MPPLKNSSQILASLLLVSIGMMTTITFGFVPLLNYFEIYMNVMYAIVFWLFFGISCIIFGKIRLVDRIEKKEYLCLSNLLWGIVVIMLNFTCTNVPLTLVLVIITAALTAVNVVVGASYLSSNVKINKRGFYAGIYLGIGWSLVALTAYISFLNVHINFLILGILNIIVGLVCFYLARTGKVKIKWEQLITIPRDYNVRKNGMIFWISSLVFSTFLGIIVFLLGTKMLLDISLKSFYLDNLQYYFATAESYNLGLVNFDFIVVGSLNLFLSPILGRLNDKYGRKPIYFLSNLLIPICLIFLAFWSIFAFIVLSLAVYSTICANYIIIESTVWSDLAPEEKIGQYNGYGWSSMGLGGTIGFIIGYLLTSPQFLAQLDILVVMTIIGLSEISMIPFVSMKDSLPPSEEMEWSKEIIHIYVIKDGGIIMTDYSFSKEEHFDADLLAGGMTGVSTILQEMIDSKQTKLQVIDHEDKKLLFDYGRGFFVVLISIKDLKILRSKLKTLTDEIHNIFREIIEIWEGDLDIFKPIITMIKNHFIED